jgi:leader peptidase (prepilin peptidase)/N-methyltransferase
MASFAGASVGLLFIVTRRGDMKYALPFGTFLALGAALAATVGSSLLDWYLRFL